MSGFHTLTLGCKLNQFDSAAIEGELSRRGFEPQPELDRASIVIVNTCTVTHRADADARKLIRRVRRRNPECRLLVTGCYAERDADELRALGGIDRVFGNHEKQALPRILDELGLGARGDRGCDEVLHFGERSRAFLRIQEGCRLACSYCIIPQVRGPSRSESPDDVCGAVQRLIARGYREIVLTGVNTGDYGRDLSPAIDLATLLRRLLSEIGSTRLRLNSLEPLTVTDEIIELMAHEPRIAPHLQVPLQSGSPEILRGMRRNYRRGSYLERLERLREAVPHACLGADVIVGFPGESGEHFAETEQFIAASPLDYLHVFSWSPRPGTPATEYPDRVTERTIGERSAQLRRLGEDRFLAFRQRFVGEELDAVVLDGTRALTGNFIEVAVEQADGPAAQGDLLRVRVTDVDRSGTRAVSTGPPTWAT